MTVYFLTGSLGAGKTLAAVGRIRDALLAGKRVATNLNIFPEKLVPSKSKATIIRLPDKPRICDLDLIGYGCDLVGDSSDYDGKRFGLLVLDECSSWLNTRTWNDKERMPVLEWFLHARKYRWDVIFIVQNMDSVDKQLREALCEHFVRVRRLDRFAVPVIGWLSRLIGLNLNMPQVHVASVYYGTSPDKVMHVERWWYRGKDLYSGYETGQVFSSGQELRGDQLVDARACHTVLSAWHIAGRHGKRIPLWRIIGRFGFLVAVLPIAIFAALWSRGRLDSKLLDWGLARRRSFPLA